MSLKGASVLVTGGTRGIGKAIALRLVADGASRVVLGYMRNDAAAEEAAALVQGAGAEVVLVRGNVADERTIEKLAAAGPYRVIVSNAATGVIRPALETEDKHWDWTLAANARSLLSLARATAPAMEEGSAIVAISSLGSQRVLPNYVLIGVSKAALETAVRYLGVELAPRGIRVNCVSGGVVDTEALDWFPNKEQMLASVKRTPAGRLVEPEDMAAAVSFLCSDDAKMICGQTIVVDGGYSLPRPKAVEPTDENLRAFDAMHRARNEPDVLPTIVERTLGDLEKKKVLHLLCSTGEATAALAALGAVVTGVDPRSGALEAAREKWPKILWVDGDPQELPRQLRRGRFDLVYSGEGVLDRLSDLDAWAAGIAAALKAGGELIVFDDHPVADCVNGLLRWRSDYFRDPAEPDRLWRIGQIVSALARAGLQVQALEEYPGGTSRRRHDRRIPATFLLYARRAA